MDRSDTLTAEVAEGAEIHFFRGLNPSQPIAYEIEGSYNEYQQLRQNGYIEGYLFHILFARFALKNFDIVMSKKGFHNDN
jgi:hypothetical protein